MLPLRHTMAEAGGSPFFSPRVLLVWRTLAGVGLLGAGWFVCTRWKADAWICSTFALSGVGFLQLAVCSLLYENGKELVFLSSSTVFLHTLAAQPPRIMRLSTSCV